jgi:hypothetical protein
LEDLVKIINEKNKYIYIYIIIHNKFLDLTYNKYSNYIISSTLKTIDEKYNYIIEEVNNNYKNNENKN